MGKMKIPAILLLALTTSCSTILLETTGEEGIVEDPTSRTAGAMIEDSSIETKVVVNLKSQEEAFRNANFHVYSHNGVVLLVGQVASEALKQRATEITSRASTKIKRIHNELEVIDNTDLLQRGNDAWIATRIKTQMVANSDIPARKVRVITENGSVYLMGMVSELEGDKAANLARNVAGVSKVVKVFEYIN